MTKAHLFLLVCILMIGVSIFFVASHTKTKGLPAPLALSNAEITALGAIVVDPNTQRVVFQKQSDRPLALASLTKIMTAIVSLEGKQEALSTANQVATPTRWSHDDLLRQLLVASSNDAATMLASSYHVPLSSKQLSPNKLFVQAMNAEAERLGLTHMKFTNVTGLDETTATGGVGTAAEVATLFWYGVKNYPEEFANTQTPAITMTAKDGERETVFNTNMMLAEFPGVVASKTGTTDLAGGNLALVFKTYRGRTLVAVVLGSTPERRYEDMLDLVAYAQRNESIGH